MHLPANTFGARHESRGEATGTSSGTAVTAAGSANTKGSWTALGAATSFAYEGFTLYAARNSLAADYVVDIGIDDGAGNNFILVPDLHFASLKQANEHNMALHIPVHVPAGALIEARVACSTLSGIAYINAVGHSTNPGGYPGYSRAVALFTPGSSRGATVDPGGTANTKGAWAELSASCPANIEAIFGVVGHGGDVARTVSGAMLLDIGIGAASSEFVMVPNIGMSWGAQYDGPTDIFFGPFAASVPVGTRIAARAACNDNAVGDRQIDLSLYGLVR